MNPSQENTENQKTEIVAQIAELSALPGMIPSDETIEMTTPMMGEKMVLSDWFSTTRKSFLKLSILIGKELDLQLQ